ncbi:hypothetical protein [Sphingopyxis sp. YF1]|nr:hypothetical protein [Sphingopyxis sp. YF1]
MKENSDVEADTRMVKRLLAIGNPVMLSAGEGGFAEPANLRARRK